MKLIRNGQEINTRPPEPSQKPLEAPAKGEPLASDKQAIKGFYSRTGRNYNAMYRAAVDFHKLFYPPVSGDEAAINAYWQRVAGEMLAKAEGFGNDEFATALLLAVFEELEREAKAAGGDAAASADDLY